MQIMKNVRKCSLRYILFIQYHGYNMNINRGKALMVYGMDITRQSILSMPLTVQNPEIARLCND